MKDMTMNEHHPSTVVATTAKGRQSGLTLTEVIGGVFLIALVVTVGYKMYVNQKEKEELLDCMSQMHKVHGSIMEMSARGSFASSGELWEMALPGGNGVGIFCYITDGPSAGTDGKGADGSTAGGHSFVLFCQHDHGSLGKYVYFTENGHPTVANEDNDPDYQRYVLQENGGPRPSAAASN